MNITNLGLSYSLKTFISTEMPISAEIKYDGMTLPKKKPFVIIEHRPTTNQQLAKLRETINITYRFQIGVFAESSYKLSEYRERLTDLFLFESIPYYDENAALTNVEFSVEPNFNIVPIFTDDITKETIKHRFYIDVEIKVNKHVNK